MIDQNEFFSKYNIDDASFHETGLNWEELKLIYEDYIKFREELEPTAVLLFNKLMKSEKVHSVRYRIKDPEHLIEKIIRKKIEDKASEITIVNYKEELTDLIGLRALHLFKEDWVVVNDFITSTWNLIKPPVANYRKGDSEKTIEFFREKNCEPKEHKYGYRSIHYIVSTQPGKQVHYGEIQVRTIFEEAWAEIDHTIRYPYDLDNPIFFQFLLILNRLSGSADEMGSFIQFLKAELELKESFFSQQMHEKDLIISDLETKMEQLDLKDNELLSVKEDLKKLREQKLFLNSGNLGTATDIAKMLKDFQNTPLFKKGSSISRMRRSPFPYPIELPEDLKAFLESAKNMQELSKSANVKDSKDK